MSYLEELIRKSRNAWKKMEESSGDDTVITLRSASPQDGEAVVAAEDEDEAAANRADGAAEDAGEDAAQKVYEAAYMLRAAAAAENVGKDSVYERGTDGKADTAQWLRYAVSAARLSANYSGARTERGFGEEDAYTGRYEADGAERLSRIFERDARRCGETFTLFE
jgi:hypothetical protein